MDESKIPVYLIHVKPRSFRYCEYIINENLSHTKTYEKLEEYLVSLLPELYKEIAELIGFKRHFLVFPEERRVQELKFDFDAEMEELKNSMHHEHISLILKKEMKKQTMDSNIHSLAKLQPWKKIP